MRGARAQRREDAEALAAAVADARRPRSCPDCGETYMGSSAWTVHRDDGQCLGSDAYGQLVRRPDGAWALLGSDAAR
jgi:hypothetical protein